MTRAIRIAAVLLFGSLVARAGSAQEKIPAFDELLAYKVALKPDLVGVHPRVFVTKTELDALRSRARTTHRAEWEKVTAHLAAMKGAPPASPGPQERRGQNDVALAIAEVSLAYAVERRPEHLAAAKAWTLAAIDYEPWGYTYNKPNTDLAAGHLLYAIGWAYDLLYDDFTAAERARIRVSLERHAGLVYDAFAPKPGRTSHFTQNHDFIPMAGLGVAALALMGESKDAGRWAVLARAHHQRAGQLLSPDGYYYEGIEYWIFAAPWLVHFMDAWEHSTGESLWDRDVFRNWKTYLAHALLPDGQSVFDFGDIWEGALTRAKTGDEYARVYPGGTLQSNFNVMYRVAARFHDPQAQAVAERYAAFGHSNLEEFWTLLWRDPSLKAAPIDTLPLAHHFEDSGVIYLRTSWGKDATAIAFKAGPPEGHRVAALLPTLPEWRLDSGHAHPDAGSFIVWAHGRYLTGDTGYAGLPSARNHNTMTFAGAGQGVETEHDVWRHMDYRALDGIRIREASIAGGHATIVADLASAYAKTTGVTTFTRRFAWDGGSILTVADAVTLSAPRTPEWHLQSDSPFEGGGTRFDNGGAGQPRLGVSFTSPTDVAITTGRATVRAPGPPGSIEKGVEEPRGYALTATARAAETFQFGVTLEMRASSNETRTSSKILAPGATVQKIAGDFIFTEGPTSDKDGNVYFVDQDNNRIMRYGTDGKMTTFMQPSGRANGMSFDEQGRLIACADEKNEMWSIDPATRNVTVLFSTYEGKLLNGPNDVWVQPGTGRIYFTDPYYARTWWHRGPKENPEAVYVYSPGDRNKAMVRVIDDMAQPNGIIGTPDGKRIYVSDIRGGKTFSYDIKADGTLANKQLFCDVGSDGMTIDSEGNVYLTAGHAVEVFDRTGRKVEDIQVEQEPANVAFGGKDRRTLFITARTGFYAVKTRVTGVGPQ